ncbi:NHL domain-containing protein [Striga hermonthica]|uniref:NHL domain-containing protein n=1 Tax=Striga hermonthica TaxID=68872 RepID=A0A9N7MRH7_STRHE|nr:NHL domain-containing protein [Striga hermonthica]
MALKMGNSVFVLLVTLLLLLVGGAYSVSAPSSPARIVNGLFSNAFSMLMKWISSLKTTTKTAIAGRPMMKFEGGYNVETVFDGSKLGIEPYSVEVLPDGDLLILDSANSNLYKISSSLSLYSRPRLVSGSPDGYAGHVDGRLREARLNHPKGVTVDDRGNIYIADTDNMAIRKISDTGVTTIAGGGKRGRGGGHVDGPSEDAKFSNDFDVVYLGSSCSLLVIDRGNKAIREIQLHFDDCAYQYGSGFPLGFAVLVAAGFFGYMLALLQRRVGSIVLPQNDYNGAMNEGVSQGSYQKPLKSSMRQPLIPTEDYPEKQDETFFASLTRLMAQTMESTVEILSGFFPIFKRKPPHPDPHHQYKQQIKYSNTWPVQESYVIPDEDEPPSIDTRTPTPKKTYAFMAKDSEKMQQLKQSRAFYSGWEGDFQKQSKSHQNQFMYRSAPPQTYYEQSSEIVFGAIQEQDKEGKSVVIKPLDHHAYDNNKVRARAGYVRGP